MSTLPAPGVEAFIHAHRDTLWRQAWALTGHRQEAEDLLQESLVRLVLAWDRIDPDRNPLAYARAVMTHVHVSRWRAARRRVRLTFVRHLPEDIAPPTDLAIENLDAIREALRSLTPRARSVLVLGYLFDYPDSEIATILGIAPSTVRSVRARALARARLHGEQAQSVTGAPDA